MSGPSKQQANTVDKNSRGHHIIPPRIGAQNQIGKKNEVEVGKNRDVSKERDVIPAKQKISPREEKRGDSKYLLPITSPRSSAPSTSLTSPRASVSSLLPSPRTSVSSTVLPSPRQPTSDDTFSLMAQLLERERESCRIIEVRALITHQVNYMVMMISFRVIVINNNFVVFLLGIHTWH